jgi:hypothetical protein
VINFRYHVVSLTAVFLALAIGLVVGTAALNGPAADALNDQVNALSRQNQQYRDHVNQLVEEANRQEDFASTAAPYILANRLLGRRVVVVAASSASKLVGPVLETLQQAGAKVTGQVEIEDKFLDPANNNELLDLANLSNLSRISDIPTNSNGVETATALLAAVLMDHTPTVSSDTTKTVLSSYNSGGYVVVTGAVTGPAEAVIVIAGQPYVDRDAAKKNAAALTMVEQFDKAGPIVAGIDGVGGDGNVVRAVRGDPTLTKTVSTVDNVSTPQGRVVLGLALAEQFGGHAGNYGIGDGASALMPKAPGDRGGS